jgi:hypothetical protein
MKVEIEIPEPPEGWVFDGSRIIKYQERYLFNGAWVLWESVPSSFPVLVCVKAKPLWEPSQELLAVLRPGWIARDRGRGWYWFSSVPFVNGAVWSGSGYRTLDGIKQNLLPPDTIPWDKSCFKIGDPQE